MTKLLFVGFVSLFALVATQAHAKDCKSKAEKYALSALQKTVCAKSKCKIESSDLLSSSMNGTAVKPTEVLYAVTIQETKAGDTDDHSVEVVVQKSNCNKVSASEISSNDEAED